MAKFITKTMFLVVVIWKHIGLKKRKQKKPRIIIDSKALPYSNHNYLMEESDYICFDVFQCYLDIYKDTEMSAAINLWYRTIERYISNMKEEKHLERLYWLLDYVRKITDNYNYKGSMKYTVQELNNKNYELVKILQEKIKS